MYLLGIYRPRYQNSPSNFVNEYYQTETLYISRIRIRPYKIETVQPSNNVFWRGSLRKQDN